MRIKLVVVAVLLTLGQSAIARQQTQKATQEQPIKATVCKILEDPAVFNNKLVQVRGYVTVSFEYSILHSESSESCSEGIWFVLPDSSPPGLAVTVPGNAAGGEKDSNGHRTPPIPVKLIRDANFEKFENYLESSAKVKPGRPCGPDCHLYQVTATFTGRIDAVSQTVHAAHLKRTPFQPSDYKGFGQMGLFDAQLVVQSVNEVEAIDLTHPDKEQAKSH